MNVPRGFHRLGLALALPIAVIGLCVTAYGAFEWAKPLFWRPVWQITDPTGSVYSYRYGDNPMIVGAELRGRGVPAEHARRFVELLDPEVETVDRARRNAADAMTIGIVTTFAAVLLFCVVRAVAWVISGFKVD
jgi:hypothetical protein